MAYSYSSPGVYREDVFIRPRPLLATGVPAFVGFAEPVLAGDVPPNSALLLHRKEEFVARFKSAAGYLADSVNGFFDNGGALCYVLRADPAPDPETALNAAIDALAKVTDIDLVAVPDALLLRLVNGQPDTAACVRVQQRLLAHCAAQGDRLALLDALPGAAADKVQEQARNLLLGLAEPVNGALYYPWLKTTDGKLIPPCGLIAGVIARSDARVGVFKAPANEELFGVLDLESSIDNRIQDQLNPLGINCLRAFPGRGIRVWGARTLSRDPNWRYISVRRLFLTLLRWIELNLPWASFEPNTPRLWLRIERELHAYLEGLWQAGALKGDTPEQAFRVKCDAENNPPDVRETGQVVTELSLAPTLPAEFVVVRVIHRVDGVEAG